jgi:hypothetical protein
VAQASEFEVNQPPQRRTPTRRSDETDSGKTTRPDVVRRIPVRFADRTKQVIAMHDFIHNQPAF